MKKHLSIWGVGPLYVGTISVITAALFKMKPSDEKIPLIIKRIIRRRNESVEIFISMSGY